MGFAVTTAFLTKADPAILAAYRVRSGFLGPSFFAHCLDDFREVARLAEVLINACETDVGDMVDGLEGVHHGFADLARFHFISASLELALNR